MKCQGDMSVQIPEFQNLSLISGLPLCEPLAPRFALLVPLDCPLDFPFSLFTLAFALTQDLLCLPLPDDCLSVLLCALQSR